jgi:F-type H+-transporting ATPase subunit b
VKTAQRLVLVTLLAIVFLFLARPARTQQQSATEPSQQTSSEQASEPKKPSPPPISQEIIKEQRQAEGEEEEENSNLKHGKMVRWLAGKIDWSVHGTHLLMIGLNFVILIPLAYWVINKLVLIFSGQKNLGDLFRSRTSAIQQALQEARNASQDANRRLADIETRLRQLDVEIGQMQAAAEKEGAAEEDRIKNAAEDDVRKVVRAAEQEIAAAAKQARRELSTHTAELALGLARQQIHIDSNTDQVLVLSFASGLSSSSHEDDHHGGKDGH